MPAGEERAYLANVAETIEQATGSRPSGWLGPALTETQQTPRLLAELGLKYPLDWPNDDQPYWLNVPGMLSVPYSVELNDLGLFTCAASPALSSCRPSRTSSTSSTPTPPAAAGSWR